MAVMVGYSYVDNHSNQPSNKYHNGQSSNNGNQSQDQLYDLLMSKLLDGAMPQPKPQDRVIRLSHFRTGLEQTSGPVLNTTSVMNILTNTVCDS